jgi:hypothetical protein
VLGTIEVEWATLDAPASFTATTVAFQVDGRVEFAWTPAIDPTGIDDYEIQYRRDIEGSAWASLGYFSTSPTEAAGLPTGSYVARIRAISSTSSSIWVEQPFTVVVAPGSLMENFKSSNDQNAAPIIAPTLPGTPVNHSLNNDGSANVQFDWLWEGDEADIDGFVVTVTNTPPE